MALTIAHRRTVLIVEDDASILDLLSELLMEEGFQPVRAKNGEEALQALQAMTELPSLIVLDLKMPVMDGISFRVAQVSDPRLCQIPVLLMSADAHIEENAVSLGLKFQIRKPLSVDQFILKVSELCR